MNNDQTVSGPLEFGYVTGARISTMPIDSQVNSDRPSAFGKER